MYKSRLKAWGLLKNAKQGDWGALAVLYDRRSRAGKNTTSFRVRGKKRTIKDLQKYVRSLSLSDEEFLRQQPVDIDIPDYISPLSDDGSDDDDLGLSKRATQGSPSNSSTSLEFFTPTSSEDKDFSGSSTESPLSAKLRPHHRWSDPSQNPWVIQGANFYEVPCEIAANFPVMRACDNLQREIEVIGQQLTSPVPLHQRTGSPNLDAWTLVEKRDSQNATEPEFDFYCARCGQPSSLHFASLDRLKPPSPSLDAAKRSLFNPPTEEDSSISGQNLASWTVASPSIATLWKWPARCYMVAMALRRGDSQGAQHIQAEADVEFERMILSKEPQLLTTAQLVTSMLAQHGQNELNQTILRNALVVASRRMDADHPVMVYLQYLTLILGDPEALHGTEITTAKMERAYRTCDKLFGTSHPFTVQTLYAYGWIMRYFNTTEGDVERAATILQAAYQQAISVWGKLHMQTTLSLATYATTLSMLGRRDEAVTHFRTVIEYTGLILGLLHPYRLEAMRRLAIILREEGERMDAELIPSLDIEQLYRDVLWGRCRTLGRKHKKTIEARADYKDVCEGRGTWVERESEVEQLFAEGTQRRSRIDQQADADDDDDIPLDEAF